MPDAMMLVAFLGESYEKDFRIEYSTSKTVIWS